MAAEERGSFEGAGPPSVSEGSLAGPGLGVAWGGSWGPERVLGCGRGCGGGAGGGLGPGAEVLPARHSRGAGGEGEPFRARSHLCSRPRWLDC